MRHRLDYFPKEELIGHYRTVFSSDKGKEVLAHMLVDLGMFIEITDGSEDVALKNYAMRLLKILSGGEPAKANVQDFVYKLMKQPLNKEKEKQNERRRS